MRWVDQHVEVGERSQAEVAVAERRGDRSFDGERRHLTLTQRVDDAQELRGQHEARAHHLCRRVTQLREELFGAETGRERMQASRQQRHDAVAFRLAHERGEIEPRTGEFDQRLARRRVEAYACSEQQRTLLGAVGDRGSGLVAHGKRYLL